MHGDKHAVFQFTLTKGVNVDLCVKRKGEISLGDDPQEGQIISPVKVWRGLIPN